MSTNAFDAPLLRIGARLDDLRQFVAYHDTLKSHPRATEMTRASRAWAYVGIAAALEDFMREFIDEMASHINAANVPVAGLRLGIVSLLGAPAFDSIASSRRQTMWDKRAALLDFVGSPAVMTLPRGMHPLDGRTIKQDHIETLWRVYGFAGPALPGPVHGLALKDLSGGRNEVAHGNTDPVTFGRSRTHADVMRRINQIEDIAVHIAAAGQAYVTGKKFLR